MYKIVVFFLFLTLNLFAQIENEFENYLVTLSEDFAIDQVHIDSLDLKSVILLDTRSYKEYEISHIDSAIWVGYDSFDLSHLDGIDKDKKLVVYCSVGYRSCKIGIKLKNNGFANVRNLYGGIFKWANLGRPLFNDSTKTNKIHTYDEYWGRFILNPLLEKVD
jgi:rhodanese-related sulfurtransferase